jgi:hypothetical protein
MPFQRVYDGTERITADVTIVMSQNDPIMSWNLGSFTMMDAVDVIRQENRMRVQGLDMPGYQHSPFSPVDISWNTLNSSKEI